MNKLEATGRLIQWAVELNEFDIRCHPRKAIKAQALVDFITEFTLAHDQQSGGEGAKHWIVHVDGLSTQYAGGVGVILQSPKRDHLEYAICLQFQMTNNETEYEALLQGLELAKSLGAELVVIQGDSQLIIGQVNGSCEAKKEQMKRYLSKVKNCIKSFTSAKFHQIPREENIEVNSLAKAASTNGVMNEQVIVQFIPSIDVPKVQQIDRKTNQTTPIESYLKDGILPEDKEEA